MASKELNNGTMEYLRKKWRELHTPKVMLLPDKI